MYTIHSVDALCGQGKTQAAINHVSDDVRTGGKVVFAVPSLKLVRELEDEFKKRSVPVRSITSAVQSAASVGKRLRCYLDTPDSDEAQVLLITHETLLNVSFWPAANKWHLIVDEVPGVVGAIPLNTSGLGTHATRMFRVEDCAYDDYVKVVGIEQAYLDALRDKDSELAAYREAAALYRTGHVDLFFSRSDWRKLLANEGVNYNIYWKRNASTFEAFGRVTIMSAFLPSTLLALAWQKDGVEFVQSLHIKPAAKPHHDIGSRNLNIKYLTDQQWSKSLKDASFGDSFIDETVVPIARNLFGRENWLLLANNDDGAEVEAPMRLKHNCHGINALRDYHNIVAVSALNPSPSLSSFIQAVSGLDRDAVREALQFHTVYQAVMRTSLRDPSSTAGVHILVGDKGTAEWLAKLFVTTGTKTVELFDTGRVHLLGKQGRPPKGLVAMSNAERARQHRLKKRLAELSKSAS